MRSARLFVTGTDTDVGKTWVSAALALALRHVLPPRVPVTIIKPVQTGLGPGEDGDAALARRLALRHVAPGEAGEIRFRELVRFAKPADPCSAALAEGRPAPRCHELAGEIDGVRGAVIVEGAGGAAVPLNARESVSQLAATARLDAVVVVGLRLGCINHALLTAHYLRALGVPIRGAVLVERWGPTPQDYRSDVVRALAGLLPVVALMPHDRKAERAIAQTAECFKFETVS